MAEARSLTLLVVSPDPALRRELSIHFERQDEIHSTAIEAETLSRAYDLVVARKPAAALIDLRENPLEALQIVGRISEESRETRLIGIYNPLQLPVSLDQSEFFLQGVRHGLFDFLRVPLNQEDSNRILERILSIEPPAPVEGAEKKEGRIIGFFSNKGGVGKTTLCANIAVALARHFPEQVAVVDASLEIGNVRDYFNVDPQYSLFDAVKAKDRLDRDLLMGIMSYHRESQVAILDTPRKLQQAAEINDEDITQVLLALRSSFRYVLVDTLPIFNAVNLAVGDLADYLIILTEALVPTVKGTRDLLGMLAEAGYPPERTRIILNRYQRFRGNVDPQWVAQSLQRSLDYVFPYERALHEYANLGEPYLVSRPRTRMAEQLERLAADIGGLSTPPKPSFLKKLIPF